jgi:putative restriction endonuclease
VDDDERSRIAEVAEMDLDLQVRMAAFSWLSQQVSALGDVLPRALLQQGFEFQGRRIPLAAPQGIFKPQMLDLPLSIATVCDSPYDDHFQREGFLIYRYRGNDPQQHDNRGLRAAFQQAKPLIYLFCVVLGRYMPVWPVYVIGDDPLNLAFRVAFDDKTPTYSQAAAGLQDRIAEMSDSRHAYITGTIKVRLHQRSFRERVLDAYRSECAFCRLKHRELLDAAHIIPDDEAQSSERIDNGISLCKLHHAAFDSLILGVSPDYLIHVRHDVLIEEDGPVLQHALKGLDRTRLLLPKSQSLWPSREALDWRYQRFAKTL